MSFFSKLLRGGLKTILDPITETIDKFTLTKDEKQQFQLEVQSRLLQLESELEQTYRTELDSRMEIIKAEMAQKDKFTKRARPSIIYLGLLFIFIIHVAIPALAYVSGVQQDQMPNISLPAEFWWAWGTVVSVYGAGRSAEKIGITNKITQIATGSKN